MAAKNHTHQYVAVFKRKTKNNATSGFHGYYKCADVACTHTRKAELILGKLSICNRCHKEFILPLAIDMLRAVPHCKDCTRKYPSREKEPAKVFKALAPNLDFESFLNSLEVEDD